MLEYCAASAILTHELNVLPSIRVCSTRRSLVQTFHASSIEAVSFLLGQNAPVIENEPFSNLLESEVASAEVPAARVYRKQGLQYSSPFFFVFQSLLVSLMMLVSVTYQ